MTTINLQQEQFKTKNANVISLSSSNFIASVGILLLVFACWGVLAFETSSFEKKDVALRNEIALANGNLTENKSVDDIVDLQIRLAEIKSNLATKIETNQVLDQIEKNVLPGITFSDYKHEEKKLNITLNASNFDNISKQILKFKQADFVSNVEVTNLVRNEKSINAAVEIKLK